VNGGVAQGAGLELRRLVVKSGGVTRHRAKADGVALQAQQVHLAARQQPRILRAMRHVAALAALAAQRGMFKDEWPGLLRVTFQANGSLRRSAAQLRWRHSAMLIVAIGAAHQLFIHSMMKWPRKFCDGFLVAAIAKLRLRFP